MYLQTLFSSKKSGWNIRIHKLSNRPEYLQQAAAWSEEAWGYLINFKGNLIDDIKGNADKFYIATYGNTMIGMFSFFDHPSVRDKLKIDMLTYVYIHPNFRNMGMGHAMLNKAKAISKRNMADMIILETANPTLNRFYEKLGAKVVCDSRTMTEVQIETSMLRI